MIKSKSKADFILYFCSHHFSAGQIRQAVRAMAVYEKRPAYRKLCWYVSDEYLSKYNLTDLPVPNPAAVQCQPAPLSAEGESLGEPAGVKL